MEQVFQYVDHMYARYIEELAELCSMRSVKGDTDGLYRTHQTVKARLSSLGFSPVEYGTPQESSILFGRRPVSGKKTLLFYNHYDVVPEGAASAWTRPPFQLTEQDGRLYGRGVSDNKGALLARLQAVEAILSVTGTLPVGTAFLLDGDEETGSMTLSRMVREEPELLREMTDADLCLAAFNLPQIAGLTCVDEMHLEDLGEKKVALFCCIPDSDPSLNYLVGMLYTASYSDGVKTLQTRLTLTTTITICSRPRATPG